MVNSRTMFGRSENPSVSCRIQWEATFVCVCVCVCVFVVCCKFRDCARGTGMTDRVARRCSRGASRA